MYFGFSGSTASANGADGSGGGAAPATAANRTGTSTAIRVMKRPPGKERGSARGEVVGVWRSRTGTGTPGGAAAERSAWLVNGTAGRKWGPVAEAILSARPLL